MARKSQRESASALSNPKLAKSLAPARKETDGTRNKLSNKSSGKLSLFPLSVEDALRAAARTGRVTAAKPKGLKGERKKRAASTLQSRGTTDEQNTH
jgi:hypothetical protein